MLKMKKMLLFPVFIWMNILLVNCGCGADPVEKDYKIKERKDYKAKEEELYKALEQEFKISPEEKEATKAMLTLFKTKASVENLDTLLIMSQLLKQVCEKKIMIGLDKELSEDEVDMDAVFKEIAEPIFPDMTDEKMEERAQDLKQLMKDNKYKEDIEIEQIYDKIFIKCPTEIIGNNKNDPSTKANLEKVIKVYGLFIEVLESIKKQTKLKKI